MKAKLISESLDKYNFEKKSDPLTSLGIGRKIMIEKWLEKMKRSGNYTINDDYTIDAGNVDLDNRDLFEFPDYIQFNKVTGWFDIRNSKLTSLRGCPEIVDNDFICSWNYLTSLEGCPKLVKGKFICHKQRNGHIFTIEEISRLCDVKGEIINKI